MIGSGECIAKVLNVVAKVVPCVWLAFYLVWLQEAAAQGQGSVQEKTAQVEVAAGSEAAGLQ